MNVDFWHKADIEFDQNMFAFGGKEDISERLVDVR